MIEELKSMEILDKVGGRFKLSSLIQKRMSELMEGACDAEFACVPSDATLTRSVDAARAMPAAATTNTSPSAKATSVRVTVLCAMLFFI